MRAGARGTAGILVLGTALASCSGTEPGGEPVTMELVRADDCAELRDYFVEEALEVVGPHGLQPGVGVAEDGAVEREEGLEAADEDMAGAETAPGAGGAPVEGEDYSGTNLQESGVDEADRVKTDGERLLVVDEDALQVLDLRGDSMRSVGAVELPEAAEHEVLLHGDSALVLSGGPHPEIRPEPHAATPASTLTLVDLTEKPEATETLRMDGGYVSARMVDGMARIVLRTEPTGLDFTVPEGTGVRAEEEATEHNREVIRESQIENWLPGAVREGGGESIAGDGTELLDCTDVHRPADFSGVSLATVVSVDLDAGLAVQDGTGVVGAGETVYASPENLYVATQQWRDDPTDVTDVSTQIHQFSLTDAEAAYTASGEVPGSLLDQWALSEHDGDLRVATTEGEATGLEEGADASRSTVRVLRPDGGELTEVGAVTDLGVDERIYAVRYIGEIGYVVTFRETDPLYTVDLSDPTDPQVLGELKIPGFSSYLHPLGEDLLLGVGQDADETGRTRGTQVSVFDVSDLADPQRIHQESVPGTHSPVEHDHRALLHWPQEELAVIPFVQRPVEVDGGADPSGADTGALAYEVGAQGITERARLHHDGGEHPVEITRSLVVGDALYTVSDAGVMASDLDTLAESDWLALR